VNDDLSLRERIEREQLRNLLWQRPIQPDSDIPFLLGMPESSWKSIKRRMDVPMFDLGHRSYIKTTDLLALATPSNKLTP
jgi:hypothetical protein